MDLDVSFNTYTCKYHEFILTHLYGEQQQKHDKMTNDRFSERLIKRTSGQPQDNDTSVERNCFAKNNR